MSGIGGAAVEIVWKEFAGEVAGQVIGKLDDIKGATGQTAKAMTDMSSAGEKAMGFLKAAGIVTAIAAAANELAKFHNETRRFTASLGDQAHQVRQTTAEYQAWVGVQDRIGNTQAQTTASLAQLNAKIQEAAGGSKTAIAAFDALGVKLLDGNGQLRSNAVLTGEVATALLRMADADKAAALAKDLLSLSGRDTNATLRQYAMGIDEATRLTRQAGQIIGDDAVDAARKLERQSQATQIAIRAFYAELALPIELKGLELASRLVREIADSVKLLGAHGGFDKAMEVVNLAGAGLGGAASGQNAEERALRAIAEKEARVVEARRQANDLLVFTGRGGNDAIAQRRQADAQASIATAEKELEAAQKVYLAWKQAREVAKPVAWAGTGFDMQGNPLTTGGAAQPGLATDGTGGGPGSSGRDRIGENLRMVTAQAQAAWQAFERMRAGQGMVLDDLRQQVELEKSIADELAKLGKYDANDPRIAQLKAQVTERERGEAALRKYLQAARDAEQIEKQMGDGTAFLRAEMARLSDALDTGRLSYEAYGVAVKNAQIRAEELRLSQQAQKDGLEGFVGGWQLASFQASQATRAGQIGAQAYAESFRIMKGAVSDWRKSGEFDFAKVTDAFGQMLIDMAFLWAQSEIAKLIKGGGDGGGGGGGGGILGSLFGALGIGGGGGGFESGVFDMQGNTALVGGFDFGGMGGLFAGGGDPPVGKVSIVGERGPEWFVPKTPGTVLNQQQMAALGVGRGGGEMHIYLHDEMLDVRIAGQINGATPRIVRASVSRSAEVAPAAVQAEHAMRGGDWRAG